MVSMDTSQGSLFRHFASVQEIRNLRFTKSVRSELEPAVVKGSVTTSGLEETTLPNAGSDHWIGLRRETPSMRIKLPLSVQTHS